MLWLTNRIVRPCFATSPTFSRHFFWKFDVADREHFVDQQDFRLEVGGHGERQAHLHPGCSA